MQLINIEPIKYFFPKDYVLIDIETEGFKKDRDDIVEISALKVRNREIVSKFDKFNKKASLSKFLKENSSITKNDINQGENIIDILDDFISFIGDDILVGHNIKFDLDFLRYNFKVYGKKDLDNGYTDTFLIGEYANPEMQSHSVSAYIEKYPNIGDTDMQHTALNDVLIENKIFEIELNILGEDWSHTHDLTFNRYLPGESIYRDGYPTSSSELQKLDHDARQLDYFEEEYIRACALSKSKQFEKSNAILIELLANKYLHMHVFRRLAHNYGATHNYEAFAKLVPQWQRAKGPGVTLGAADREYIDKVLNKNG